ncbi:MAG: sensor domain-containing diguanylate cyclase [Lysinibacillus sp.]
MKSQLSIGIFWILFMSFGLFFVYRNYSPEPIEISLLVSFLLMACVVSFFPLMILGRPIFLIQWVSLAVFLQFGLFVEIVFFQVALVFFFLRVNKANVNYHEYIYYSIKFFVAALVSGTVFLVLGGEINSADVYHVILFATLHQLVFVFVAALLDLAYKMYDRRTDIVRKNYLVLEVMTVILAFPFGTALYFLTSSIGFVACFLLITPFIFMTYIMQKYDYSGKVNHNLKQAVQIGHELSENLSREYVLELFINRITEMVPGSKAYLIDNDCDGYRYLKGTDDKAGIFSEFEQGRIEASVFGQAFVKKEHVLFQKRNDWTFDDLLFLEDESESVMITPIQRNNEIKGVLIMVSASKSAFHASQVWIVDLLCSYLAVALEKIRIMEETIEKSEQCMLTELHNYRYFDKQMAIFEERLNSSQYSSVSLIMMDIDHFKNINDTYGHESGNIILQKFAAILRANVREDLILARYGGEEFVILLPNVSKEDTLKIAERLREIIEKQQFDVVAELDEVRSEISVYITVSIGVSTAPEDGEQVTDLLRNADRALYIGAKRNGRNRVASYEK